MTINALPEKEELYRQFRSRLSALGGNSRLVSPAELGTEIAEILIGQKFKNIVAYDSPYLQSINFKESIKKVISAEINWFSATKPKNFNERKYRAALAGADVAMTSADYLIAQTGTAVFPGIDNPSKLISLLPPSLIVVASINCLRFDLATVNKELPASGEDQSSSVIFFTGPSRTADIEKILVLGVHGPKELFVIVVDD